MDLNSDLVVANTGSDSISVLIGQGNGAFNPPQPFGVGAGAPVAVAIDQVVGLPFMDVVTANRDSMNVSILEGDGNGGFTSVNQLGVGRSPRAVVLQDVDQNNTLDIVTANAGDNSVSVLWGQVDGSFMQQTFPVGREPLGVKVARVFGDGENVIVTANSGSNNVSVLRGVREPDGSFAFVAGRSFGVGRRPVAVEVADLDLDTIPELITVNSLSDDISILAGMEDDAFLEGITFPVNQGFVIGAL